MFPTSPSWANVEVSETAIIESRREWTSETSSQLRRGLHSDAGLVFCICPVISYVLHLSHLSSGMLPSVSRSEHRNHPARETSWISLANTALTFSLPSSFLDFLALIRIKHPCRKGFCANTCFFAAVSTELHMEEGCGNIYTLMASCISSRQLLWGI